LNLNSDTVYLIWLSNEFWSHQNHLLNGCYLNSASNYLFTEWVPFLLIPQIISNFDPSVVRIMAFIIYILVILVFSIIVFITTNNIINSLFFAAIMANLNFGGSIYYLTPAFHIGTLFFSGVLLLLLIKFLSSEEEFPVFQSILFIILLDLSLFSDSILIVWLVVPYLILYLFLFDKKNKELNFFIFLSAFSAFFIGFLKINFIRNFNNIPLEISPRIIDGNLNYYLDSLLFLTTGYEKVELAALIIALIYIFALLSHLARSSIDKNEKYHILILFLIISFIITSVSYLIFGVAIYDMATARYLIFSALSLNLSISLFKFETGRYAILISIIIIVGALSNYSFLANLTSNNYTLESENNFLKYFNQNQEENELIKFLQTNNLTNGYGEYWDSNIINCLSRESIIVRPITIRDGEIIPFRLLSCERWFDQKASSKFLIYNTKRNVFLPEKDLDLFLNKNPSQRVFNFRNYKIYVFDNISLND